MLNIKIRNLGLFNPMFAVAIIMPNLTSAIEIQRMVRYFYIGELFSGPLNLLYSWIAKLENFITILTNQVIVLFGLV